MGTKFTVKLAGCSIGVSAMFSSTKTFCAEYLTGEAPMFSVEVTWTDILFEREKSAREDEIEGVPVRHFSDEYLETLAVYRRIAEKLPKYDTMLFHGSVIAVDGMGYLFTAKSGTGKSTHTGLWRRLFEGRVVMVNDDKPLLRMEGGNVFACGTPWNGKHRLGSNLSVPLKAICILERSSSNHVERISKSAAFPMLVQQSYRPLDSEALAETLLLLDRLGNGVKLYHMGCNMEPEAAQTAYEAMRG